MSLLSLLAALGGLGLFILGMKTLSDGLQKFAGDRFRRAFDRITGNRLSAALTGSGLASLLQSSSAAALLVIGFTNAGLVSVYQTLAILLGTGLGTTITIQILAFQITAFALPAIFVGTFLRHFVKRRRLSYLGNIILGTGLLFLGLQIMQGYSSGIGQALLLKEILRSEYLARVSAALCGAMITLVVQSSSATVGIVIALAGSGVVGFDVAASMVIGETLGVACTTVFGSIGGTNAARRASLLYLGITVCSIITALTVFPYLIELVRYVSPLPVTLYHTAHGAPTTVQTFVARQLANLHTLFSIGMLVVFLPLTGLLARSTTRIRQGNDDEYLLEARPRFLDDRILNTPPIALRQARNELQRMSRIAGSMFDDVIEQFYKYDAKRTTRIRQKEAVLDILQRDLTGFLIQLSRKQPNVRDSVELTAMLQIVIHLEHIGDQNEALLDFLLRKKEERLLFSTIAMSELKGLSSEVAEMVHLAVAMPEELKTRPVLAEAVEKKHALQASQDRMHKLHVKRMSSGRCNVASGIIYNDMVASLDRIAEYAFEVIEIEEELNNEIAGSSN